MGTECIGAPVNDDDGIPPVPPGFASFTQFTLQRVQEIALASVSPNNSLETQVDLGCSIVDEGKFKKSLRQRPWVNYSQFDNSSEEESDSELREDAPSIRTLPKGVIRGCAECENCQKVTAKWRPEEAHRPILDEAPVFYPTEEEFKDTLRYIASIRPRAEPYGICRIVPPLSWKPPCPLKEKAVWENSKFSTRIQKVHKLQNRESIKKICRNNNIMRRKRQKLMETGAEGKNGTDNIVNINMLGSNFAERFGFEPGPNFTLESFQKYADNFKEQYFHAKDMGKGLMSGQCDPLPENIEGEYWRIVEHPTEEIEVLYGADLETGEFGSGFPKASTAAPGSNLDDPYMKSGWNLNNFPRLPGSVLSFESGDISGVLVPWLYIGMCFSSFCWHVEDHHLYSLNYLHWGAPKMWYGVPGTDAVKLEAAMKKHLADLFEEQPDLLHNLVTQFSPSALKLEGVPVYRCLQRSGEFVLTFPRAYHSGFNCGFNCAEAVNVAPIDWLPRGQNAVELYCEQMRKISISHDKLLLGAARESVRAQWKISFMGENTVDNLRWKDACGPGGILANSLKARVEMERLRREFLCSVQSRKMDVAFDANCERECDVCHYDLHLSAAGCSCSPNKFTCLIHAKQLCSCDWSSRFFLFRYELTELVMLTDAVGGKLSAVHKWGVQDLGLSLSSVVKKEKSLESKLPMNRTTSSEATKPKDLGSLWQGSASSSRTLQETKASIPQQSSLDVRKEREKMRLTVDSKEPCLQSISSSKSGDSQNPKAPDEFTPNTKNQNSCSQLHLSNSSVFVSDKDKYASSRGRDVIILTGDKYEGPKAPDEFTSNTRNQNSCSQLHLSSSNIFVSDKDKYASSRGRDVIILTGDKYEGPKAPDEFTSNTRNQNSCSQLHLSSSSIFVSDKDKYASPRGRDVIILTGDKYEGPKAFPSNKMNEEPFVKNPETSARVNYDDTVTTFSAEKEKVLVIPETNACIIDGSDNTSQHVVGKCSNHASEGIQDQGRESPPAFLNESLARVDERKTSHHANSIVGPIASDVSKFLATNEVGKFSNTNAGNHLRQQEVVVSAKVYDDGKIKSDSAPNLTDGVLVTGGMSCLPKNIDRQIRVQKGPRIARVVRKVNCTVEPLEYGVIFSGKLWSTSQAIFPKGYRSRVRYFNVLDPSQMCYYVCEILDAGLIGPLFMVKLEQCPSEVFIHVSAAKSWELVREKVNNEIRRHAIQGKPNLPSVQPPGSVDGLEMFGLTSPAIVQAIEAIDQNRCCTEYWSSRPQQPSKVGDHGPLIDGSHVILRGLLKKGSQAELHALYRVLSSDQSSSSSRKELLDLLNDEIQNCSI